MGTIRQCQPYAYTGELRRTLRPGFQSSVDYIAAIIENIKEHRGDGKPFFALLALQTTHDPFQPPDDWLDRYDACHDAVRAARIERMQEMGLLFPEATVFPRLPSIPAWEELSAEERRVSARGMELYAGMLEHMDTNIGELPGYPKRTGLDDDTLIFFSSDNGSGGNFFEIGAPWDNSRFEDWGRQGTGIEALQGTSLAPLLADPAAEVRGPSDWIGWQLVGNSAVRKGDGKMMRLCEPSGTGDWQLCDLATDPAETIDLASERSEIRDELLQRWDEHVARNNVVLPDISPVCPPGGVTVPDRSRARPARSASMTRP